MTAGFLLPGASFGAEGGTSGPDSLTPESVTPLSVIALTYQNNLLISAARYEMEAARLEFDRFERNLSQFIPFILENEVEHTSRTFLDPSNRRTLDESEASSSLGMEKEFFDGRKISVGVGARAYSEEGVEYGSPFVQTELEMPLFSSFTRLERITERNFEESQMLESWLSFIETVQDTSEDSQSRYFSLQQSKHRRDIAMLAVEDLKVLLQAPELENRMADKVQIEDLMQFFQSEAVGFQGEIDSFLIDLMDVIGLPDLLLEEVKFLDFEGDEFYGDEYLEKPLEFLIEDALVNDVRMRILEIAKENAELKKRLSIQGKWEIIGRLFGSYDFRNRGDDPTEEDRYFLGVGFDVQRNDPQLLRLSRMQAQAEIRRFEAEIAYRRRQIYNRIRRLLIQAVSLREFVGEVVTSRESRLSLYEQKEAAYLKGEETVENLLTIRESLYHVEGDVVEAIKDFYEIIIDLDSASGLYFRELSEDLSELEFFDDMSLEEAALP